MNTDTYLAMIKMRCGIPNAYILDITMYKMHVYPDNDTSILYRVGQNNLRKF